MLPPQNIYSIICLVTVDLLVGVDLLSSIQHMRQCNNVVTVSPLGTMESGGEESSPFMQSIKDHLTSAQAGSCDTSLTS